MFMAKYETQIYSILRIITGFLFLWHGSQKLFDIPNSDHSTALYVIIIAGPIEFFGGILIMIGLFTQWAAFIASGEMAYAYFSVHFPIAFLPLINHGELAMLYCFLFLFFSAKGSGEFSFDHYLKNKSHK